MDELVFHNDVKLKSSFTDRTSMTPAEDIGRMDLSAFNLSSAPCHARHSRRLTGLCLTLQLRDIVLHTKEEE